MDRLRWSWTCLFAGLTLAGCAPGPRVAAGAATPRPDSARLAPGVDVAYELELVREPFPFANVTITVRGSASGVTHLALESWGGIERPENEVHALEARDEGGHPLPVDHFEGASWTVRGPPSGLIRVHYALVSTQHDVGYESSSYYRALIQPHLFHVIGSTALLYVKDVPDVVRQTVELRWKGFREAGWTVASSFSVDQDGFRVTETSSDFRQAVFLAGDVRLVRRDIHGSPLWLAIAGRDWGFTDDELADTAAKIVLAQRSFFGDYEWPFFLISVIPVGRYHPDSFSQGGTGLTHSFAIFLTPKTRVETHSDGRGLAWLLSHELFHLWNGHRYEVAQPEELAYWFTEGFTNFYARRLLYRADLLSVDAYVNNVNQEVAEYTMSRVKTEPASRIAADFWKDRAVHDLPYQRGDLVAMMVDREIRRTSSGKQSLDDLMKELLSVKHTPAPKFSSSTFLEKIAAYTSPEFAESIRRVAIDGAMAPLSAELLEPCLHGRPEQLYAYDAGFDEAAAHSNRVVSGVVPGSSAYAAGLRDGQKIVSWRVHRGDARKPLEAIVEEAGVRRSVSYLPQGKPAAGWAYAADPSLVDGCRSIL